MGNNYCRSIGVGPGMTVGTAQFEKMWYEGCEHSAIGADSVSETDVAVMPSLEPPSLRQVH